jgi:hypothetical protein
MSKVLTVVREVKQGGWLSNFQGGPAPYPAIIVSRGGTNGNYLWNSTAVE